MKRKLLTRIKAYIWPLIESLLFWEKATVQSLKISTLYPLSGVPFVLTWEAEHALWVRIRGMKGVFPPKGELAMRMGAGHQQIELVAVGLYHRAKSKLTFIVAEFGKKAFSVKALHNTPPLTGSSPFPEMARLKWGGHLPLPESIANKRTFRLVPPVWSPAQSQLHENVLALQASLADARATNMEAIQSSITL